MNVSNSIGHEVPPFSAAMTSGFWTMTDCPHESSGGVAGPSTQSCGGALAPRSPCPSGLCTVVCCETADSIRGVRVRQRAIAAHRAPRVMAFNDEIPMFPHTLGGSVGYGTLLTNSRSFG